MIGQHGTDGRTGHAPPELLPARIQTTPWIALLSLTGGYVIVLLYTGIVFTASAAIEHGLHASFAQLLWILNGFALVFAILLIPAGRVSQLYGPRRTFIIGLILFTGITGSAGASRDANVLIALRLLQGVGAALMTTQSLSYITVLFPPRERSVAIGVWGGVTGTSGILGPVIGGFMVTVFDWQAVFYLAIPLGLMALVTTYFLVPEVKIHARHQLDLIGLFLLAAGLFCGLYAVIEAQVYDWGPIVRAGEFSVGPTRWSIVSIDSLLVYAGVILAVFVWRDRRAAEPMLPISLFRERNFVLGTSIGVIQTFSYFGVFIPVILFLETVLGLSAIDAGLSILPMGICSALFSPVAGRMTQRFDGKYVLVCGEVLIAIGFVLLMFTVALDNKGGSLVLPLAVIGFGFAFSYVPVTALTMRRVSAHLASGGSGYLNASRQVAGSMGGAVLGTILANQIAAKLARPTARAAVHFSPALRPAFRDVVKSAVAASYEGRSIPLPSGLRPDELHRMLALAHHAGGVAFLSAMRPTLAVPLAATICAAAAALFMRDDRVLQVPQESDAGVSVERAAV